MQKFFLSALCALAMGSASAQAADGQQVVGDMVRVAADSVFSEDERRIIRHVLGRAGVDVPGTQDQDDDDADDDRKDYKHKGKGKGKGKDKGMPPGLAKKGGLPPGLAKKQTLPPGWAKRDLPEDLSSRLPPPPKGTERVIVDNDVVLIEKGTDLVLDIITDVLNKN